MKRTIKYDDSVRSLVLDAKIDEEDGWIRIDVDAARAALKNRTESNIRAIKQATLGGKAGRRALMFIYLFICSSYGYISYKIPFLYKCAFERLFFFLFFPTLTLLFFFFFFFPPFFPTLDPV